MYSEGKGLPQIKSQGKQCVHRLTSYAIPWFVYEYRDFKYFSSSVVTDTFGVPLYQPLVDAANASCAFEFIIAYELQWVKIAFIIAQKETM